MVESNNYTHIATATTTVVKSGRATLKSIVCNDVLAGTVSIFDNTAGSGTTVAIIAAGALAGTAIEYNCDLAVGLTVVTAGADDITVIFSE